MPSRKHSKKSQLAAWLSEHQPQIVDTGVREEIARAIAPVSPRYLRELLRDSGAALDPLVEGVRQDSWENLERTLSALAEVYEAARERGDAASQRECRRLVIEAKDHAKWRRRDEMAAWMLTWLENPTVFPVWVRLLPPRN